MSEIRSHKWYQQYTVKELEGIIVGVDSIPIIREVSEELRDMLNDSLFAESDKFIQNNKHNQVTSTYYLLIKKLERKIWQEQGKEKDYVYEQVTEMKR